MKKMALPIPVRRALRKLGKDMQVARRRRRISTVMMSERAGISRTTLHKIEQGDSGVSISAYATVLFILGMIDRLVDLADISKDVVGLGLEESRLSKRIRRSKRRSDEE